MSNSKADDPNRPRQTVEEDFFTFSDDCPLHEQTVATIAALIEKHGSLYANHRFHCEPYGYDGAENVSLRGDRMEHDWEYKGRLETEDFLAAREAQRNQQTEAKERAEYERLRKKYG